MFDAIARRPVLALAALAVGGVLLVGMQIENVAEETRRQTALEAASSYSAAISAIRDYYASVVVPRARAAGVEVTHAYREHAGAIPLPATLTIELGQRVSADEAHGSFRLYSAYPFPWRSDGGPHDAFERDALAAFAADPGRGPFVRMEEMVGQSYIRYAAPVRMKKSCVGCHNGRADSPRTDWKVGDIRGVQSIRVPAPPITPFSSPELYLGFLALVAGVGAAILLFWAMLRRLRRALATEHRLLELAELRNAELSEAKLAAESANRTKSEFMANMSHELKTPLNAIIGFAEVIAGAGGFALPKGKIVEYAEDIRASGAHLLTLITDILDIARIDAGRLDLDERRLDLADALHSCLAVTREPAKAGGLTLQASLPADLPPLLFDARCLRKIVVNLLSNAVKFTPEGGRVSLVAEVRDDGLAIVVSDSGVGMDPADVPRVMAPFQQVDGSLARRYDGSGLGLALSKALIELHGGRIEIETAPGAGTTVTVHVPAHRVIRDRVAAA